MGTAFGVGQGVLSRSPVNMTFEHGNSSNETSGSCSYVDGDVSRFDAFLFVIISSAAIVGNVIVFVCYARYRCLRSVTNVFIVSLSVSDLIVAGISIPFSYAVFVCGFRPKQDHGRVEDLIYIICDMVPSMLSIYSLTLVAVDRAVAIKKPFFHNKFVTRRTAWAAVLVTWLLAFVFVSMLFAMSRMRFTLFIIMMAYFIPVLIMIISYGIIGYVAKTHAKKISVLERTASRLRNEGMSLLQVTGAIAMSNMASFHASPEGNHTQKLPSAMHVDFNQNGTAAARLSSPPTNEDAPKSFLVRAIRKISSGTIQSQVAQSRFIKREFKAAMTLALILGCFIVSWTPFIGANIAYYCCPDCPLDSMMIKYFKILHYFNSALNPILYILLNKSWRAAFVRTVFCKAKHQRRSSDTAQTDLFGW